MRVHGQAGQDLELVWRPQAVDHLGDIERRWQRPKEELLAELHKGRVCGIRGRYRVIKSMWEHEHGITEADIDAP